MLIGVLSLGPNNSSATGVLVALTGSSFASGARSVRDVGPSRSVMGGKCWSVLGGSNFSGGRRSGLLLTLEDRGRDGGAEERQGDSAQPSAEWADRCQHEAEIVNHPGAPGLSARESLNSSMASVRPTSSGGAAPAEGLNGFFDGMIFTFLKSFNSVAQTRGAGQSAADGHGWLLAERPRDWRAGGPSASRQRDWVDPTSRGPLVSGSRSGRPLTG